MAFAGSVCAHLLPSGTCAVALPAVPRCTTPMLLCILGISTLCFWVCDAACKPLVFSMLPVCINSVVSWRLANCGPCDALGAHVCLSAGRDPATHPDDVRGTGAGLTETSVATVKHYGTLQIALTESERGSIVAPRPFDCIQFGGESIPYTQSHLSLLYWRLGLCQADKFECLALGNKLSAYIDGLRTERKEADPRMLALIGTSGSGKTRSLLELLCLRFGLLLVADPRGNGGASDFARVVRCD